MNEQDKVKTIEVRVSPLFTCPECEAEIDEETTECPGCGESLIRCDQCGDIVTTMDYVDEVFMCNTCWHMSLTR